MGKKWFDSCQVGISTCEDPLYSLDLLKKNFEVRELLPDSGWVVYRRENEDAYGFWLHFAIMHFYTSLIEGKETQVECVFYGEGSAGELRECRHTYWGKDGYIFYPRGPLIKKAFEALSEFFDDMV